MDEKELLWRLGQRIKEIRDEKGIKQVDLAYSLGYDRSNMSRLESGRINPRFTTLLKVANELKITLPELLAIDYKPKKPEKKK